MNATQPTTIPTIAPTGTMAAEEPEGGGVIVADDEEGGGETDVGRLMAGEEEDNGPHVDDPDMAIVEA